jgi:pimeloyl-ACP methyl ester carboxylesterase
MKIPHITCGESPVIDHGCLSYDSFEFLIFQGGGGIPISTLEFEAISVVAALNGSVSVYATDKRGVGLSSLLECPTSIVANFTACLPFITQNRYRLKHNTFTNTARDLQYVLKVTAARQESVAPRPRVVLMASSQGTYLVQRYLHLMEENEPVDAIILDAVLPTDITRLAYGDTYLNYIFLDLFTRCAQDQHGCASNFEDANPIRALYTYKMDADFQQGFSCLASLNTTSEELGKKVIKCTLADRCSFDMSRCHLYSIPIPCSCCRL